MASQLLRAPEKGARQQELIDEQQLELRTQMAAHYLQTDHDTDGGRLIQGQVDHTLLVGHRVRTSTEELEKLRVEFGTDQLQLEKCPVCQRTVTHGEFGVDHVRSPRFEVLRCLHSIDVTRVHLTMTWVVYFSILRPFGLTATPRADHVLPRGRRGARDAEGAEYAEDLVRALRQGSCKKK